MNMQTMNPTSSAGTAVSKATNIDNYASLSSSTSLVELSIGQSTGRKKDKRASEELCDTKGASKKAAAVHKRLFGECDELDAIQKCVSAARRTHEFMTVPWGNLGQRMLTTMQRPKYIEEMTGFQNEFHKLVEEFGQAHPTILQNVSQELGALYDPNDYEDWSTLRNRFRFTLRHWPTPDTGDIRTDLPKQALEEMKADMEAAIQENLVTANNNLWQRLSKVCKNMSARLEPTTDGKKQRFNDTLVSNVEDMVELMRTLNVTNDPQMTQTANRIEDVLRGITPDALREDEYMRGETKREIDDVLASLPNLDI